MFPEHSPLAMMLLPTASPSFSPLAPHLLSRATRCASAEVFDRVDPPTNLLGKLRLCPSSRPVSLMQSLGFTSHETPPFVPGQNFQIMGKDSVRLLSDARLPAPGLELRPPLFGVAGRACRP